MLTYAAGLGVLGVASLAVVLVLRLLPDVFLRSFASIGISGANLVWLGLGVSFLVMLPPTLILGALFPLVSRIVGTARSRARAVGDVYFANTLGSASGAFCAGFLLIPFFGLRVTMAVAVAVNLATAAFVLLSTRTSERDDKRNMLAAVALLGAVLVMVFPPSWRRPDFALGAYYRSTAQLDFGLPEVEMPGGVEDELLYYREGINCTVSVHKSAKGYEEGVLSMRVNGKTDASISDMSTQVLSGHLPVLFGGEGARRALVIGYASGVTVGSLALSALDAVDVCEIEPAVIEASRWFDPYNHRPLERDDVNLIVNDGRTVLATSRGIYDVVISEPSNPWMSGCANLFTAEFFEEAHAALVPGGRLLQWIQLYGMDEAGLASVLSALHGSFRYAYGFLFDAGSADLLVVATDEPLGVASLPRWERLSQPVRDDLSRVRVFSTADLWSLLALGPEDLARFAQRAPVTNTDDSMFVELRAPWYLYDDTPHTSEALRSVARGIMPLIEADDDRFDVSDEIVGELALSYLGRRLDGGLAAPVYAALEQRGDRVFRAVYEAERGIFEGAPSDPSTMARFDLAVELAPALFAPRYHRGWLLNRLGRYDEAERDLSLAVTLRPDHLEARYERATCLAELGRHKEAYDEIAALLETPLVESEPRLWSVGAYLAGGFGRLGTAIDWGRQYVELEPLSPDVWLLLARWYELIEHPDEQREALASAELAQRGLVRETHWLARWHEHYGTREEAILGLQATLELDPDNELARADLKRLGGTLP